MIFITGGTGFVGRATIRRLLSEGEKVRSLYRSEGRRHFIKDPNVEWVQGEINSVEAVRRGMEGVEAVIHLVGILIEPGGQTFEKVHFQGTLNALEAAHRSGVRRFLHMSALGTRPGAASRYHQTKWMAEEVVRASTLDATIFRPSLIFGREDVSINLLAKVISYSPLVPVLGSGKNCLQPVWVEDVAECFVRSLHHKISYRKTYSLCGPRSYTLNELIDLILQIKKSPRLKFHLPIPLLKGPAALMERILPHPPLTRDQLIMLQENNICTENEVSRDLGISFRGLEEVLSAYLK